MVKEKLIFGTPAIHFYKFDVINYQMKKKALNIIIAFICLSLAGIVAVQYFWIYNAIKVKEAQFDRSVNEALGVVVNKLETREDIAYLKKNLIGDSVHSLVQAFTKDPILALNDKLDSLLKSDETARPPFPQARQPNPEMFTDEDMNANLIDLDSVIAYHNIGVLTQAYSNGFTIEWNAEFDAGRLDSMIRANQQRIASGRPVDLSEHDLSKAITETKKRYAIRQQEVFTAGRSQ